MGREILASRLQGGLPHALRQLADNVPVPLASLDAALRYRFVNRAYAALLSAEPDAVIGRKVSDVIGLENFASVEPRLASALCGHTQRFEIRYQLDGVGARDLEVTYVPDRRGNGSVVGILVSITDLTEHKRSEHALRESEERFRNLADAMPQLVWIAAADGAVDYYNSRAAQYGGLERTGNGHWHWAPIVHPDELGSTRRAWHEAVQHGTLYEREHRLLMKDGSYRWHLSRAYRIATLQGTTRWFGTATDIHELKEAQHALREADRRKDEFLAVLGHELRNPLAAIRNATDLLGLVEPREPKVQRAYDVLARQTEVMRRLIDDLLEATRMERGKIQLEHAPVELGEIVRATLRDREHELSTKGLQLRWELASEPIWITGDAVRIGQVVDNLVGNAIKFTDAPGVITIALSADAEHARLSVADTGIGIRAELLESIFEPFQQETQDIARASGGLGLGLALAKGLVEMHDGSIEARSGGPGQGTEVYVRLPRIQAPKLELPRSAASTARPLQVLVVEDNVDAAEVLRDLLQLRGHDVAVASQGYEALRHLKARHFDVLVCDLGMPDMNGYELARAVRADPASVGIVLVAVTGYGQPDDRMRTHEAGFDEHLVKPVDLHTLDAVFERLASEQRVR